MWKQDDKRSIAIKASNQNVEIVGKNAPQIRTFSRSLQTGKWPPRVETAAGKRQTHDKMSDHVTISAVRGKKIRGALKSL